MEKRCNAIANFFALELLHYCIKPSICEHKAKYIPRITYMVHAYTHIPDSKIPGANLGPTCVLSEPDGPHIGPMNLAIRDPSLNSLANYIKWNLANVRQSHASGEANIIMTAWQFIDSSNHKAFIRGLLSEIQIMYFMFYLAEQPCKNILRQTLHTVISWPTI